MTWATIAVASASRLGMPHLHSLRAVDDREEESRVHYDVDKKVPKKVLKQARQH